MTVVGRCARGVYIIIDSRRQEERVGGCRAGAGERTGETIDTEKVSRGFHCTQVPVFTTEWLGSCREIPQKEAGGSAPPTFDRTRGDLNHSIPYPRPQCNSRARHSYA